MKWIREQPNRRFGLLDALGVTGWVGLLVARFVPIARLPFWGCVLRQRTGWPCLGCGLTRVADHVSHFHFAAAWEANPFGTVAAIGFALLAIYTVLHLGFRITAPRVELGDREAWALRVVVVLAVTSNYAYLVIKAKFPQLLG
ncbi:MAG: DUF2752 domain-containing protein [Myxococcaceae bacterium]